MTTSGLDLLKEQQTGGGSKFYPGLVLTSGMTKEIKDEVEGVSVGKILNRKTGKCAPSVTFVPLSYRTQYIALKLNDKGQKTKEMDFSTDNKQDSRLVGRIFTGKDKNVQIKHIYTVVDVAAPTELLDLTIPNNSNLPAQWAFSKLIVDSGAAIWANKYTVTGAKREGQDYKTLSIKAAGSVDKKEQEAFVALVTALENPAPAAEEGDSTEIPF